MCDVCVATAILSGEQNEWDGIKIEAEGEGAEFTPAKFRVMLPLTDKWSAWHTTGDLAGAIMWMGNFDTGYKFRPRSKLGFLIHLGLSQESVDVDKLRPFARVVESHWLNNPKRHPGYLPARGAKQYLWEEMRTEKKREICRAAGYTRFKGITQKPWNKLPKTTQRRLLPHFWPPPETPDERLELMW